MGYGLDSPGNQPIGPGIDTGPHWSKLKQKKKKKTRKKVGIMQKSKITKAIKALEKAILSEMADQTAKHRVTIKESEKRQEVIDNVADILHNVPKMKHCNEEKDVEKAWNILDKAQSKS